MKIIAASPSRPPTNQDGISFELGGITRAIRALLWHDSSMHARKRRALSRFGRVPADGRDAWLPSMGVLGPMARNVPDLAMLLAVQAGYDARVPLSLCGNGSSFEGPLEIDLKGKRIAWVGDFNGYVPYEPGALEVCERALKTFESLGCIVEEALPDFPVDTDWRAWLRFRAWQSSGTLLPYYNDPAKRALLKRYSKSRAGSNSRPLISPPHRLCVQSGINRCVGFLKDTITSLPPQLNYFRSMLTCTGRRRSQVGRWNRITNGRKLGCP